MSLELLDDPIWQMSRGERAAVVGLLGELRPELAIEIGSMEGACLRWIARYAGEVHSFDLQPPTVELPAHVHLHTGDSHELLPRVLGDLAEQGRNVDLVIVDGDHSPEGVRQDLEDLLDSAALRRSVILVHDVANERVRAGVDSVYFAAWPKVAHVELDWIPGQLFAEPGLRNELWYGLGLILIDAERTGSEGGVYEQRYHRLVPLLAEVRRTILLRETAPPAADSAEEGAELLRRWLGELDYEVSLARGREAELDGELARLRGREDELNAQLAELSARHQLTERALSERHEQALQEVLGRLQAAEHALAEMTSRWERADHALEDIKSSASWRVTKPLRGVKRGARGAG